MIKIKKNINISFVNSQNDMLVRQVESINPDVTACHNFMDAIELEIVEKSRVNMVYMLFFEKIIL